MFHSPNIRELTKKEKYKGITRTSWSFIILIGLALWSWLFIFVIPIIAILYIFFYVLEYFDDDIMEIIQISLKNRSTNEFFS